MSKFDEIIASYTGGIINEQDPAMMAPPAAPVDPAGAPAPAPPAGPAPAPADATEPAPEDEGPMTPEGRIQMLDLVRKALLVSPTDLKDSEKMELSTAMTHETVETKKKVIEKIFSRLDATGTTDLNGEEPSEDF